MINAKQLTIILEKHIYEKFKNRCDFYDMTPKDLVTTFIIKFTNGELDKLFDIPELPDIKKSNIHYQYKGIRLR